MRYKVMLFFVYVALVVAVCGCEPGFFAAVYYLYSAHSKETKPPRKVHSPLQITTTSLPDAYDGQAGYSWALTATGGTGSYSWGIVSGSLPPFLSFDSSGLISGDIASIASANSPYNFTVEVTDANNKTARKDFTLVIHPELQITTVLLPDGYDGQTGYSVTLTATGGTGTYTWSIASGNLPSNLSLDPSTGLISGDIASNASASSPFRFTVEVTDGQQTASKQFDLVVNTPAPPKADFQANPAYGTAPLTVNFTDKSTGNPTSWEWDFDNDGSVDSTQQNPTYTYSNPGWYTVKLTVSDGTDTNTCVKERYVLVSSGVYYVDGVNGDDGNGGTGWSDAFATIEKALSVAGDYDLVLVADATYNETDLNFNGKKICLKGVDHNNAGAQPVIDCQQAGRAFYFGSGETSDSVIDNFQIENGSSYDGGAIYCDASSPTITNCRFKSNKASDDGGAIYCFFSSPTVVNCRFSGNSADWYGGAIRCFSSSSPSIVRCTFSGNSADYHGGAIYCHESSPTIRDCTFSGNSADDYGGAIRCISSSSPTIVNCVFDGNSAGSYGGAIRCSSSSSLTVTNCSFSGNSASYGGAIQCSSSSSPTLNNCILWGNSASVSGDEIYIEDSGSSCTLNYCCVDNTGYGGLTGRIRENNCIHSDPQFVDAANGDYHLKDTSPCIDAGDNSYVPSGVTTDLDGNQRIVDGDNDGTATVDIGAYEYQSSAQPLRITTTALPDATEGGAYSYRVTATGGNAANYNWSVSGQPSWLSIDASTGELSGTPPAGSAGTYTFTVTVTDGVQTAS
ncbi:MAG: hypothetical protein DRP63_04520, partial [Planctomycetota bacterium]